MTQRTAAATVIPAQTRQAIFQLTECELAMNDANPTRAHRQLTSLSLAPSPQASYSSRRNKAESIHDLRASSVSSMLKVPPSTPPPRAARRRPLTPSPAPPPSPPMPPPPGADAAFEMTVLRGGGGGEKRKGGRRRANDEVQQASQGFAGGGGGVVHRHTCSAAAPAAPPAPLSRWQMGRRRRRRLLRRLLRWPPKLIELPAGYGSDVGEEFATERRECYILDEVETMRVVPVAENCNRHKRVSL